MARIVYIYQNLFSFVKDDLVLLKEHYKVRCFHFDSNRYDSKIGRLYGLLFFAGKQLFWLPRELLRARVVYGWFADYHMVLPILMARLFRKPVVVALGGFDCILMPHLNYGVFYSWWRRFLARFVLRHAALLLPVTSTLMRTEAHAALWPEAHPNGAEVNVPGLKTRYEVVLWGYDPDDWPMGPAERPAVVCTVALLDSERTFQRKGIDLLIEASRRLPDVSFTIVGVASALRSIIEEHYQPPSNVFLMPPKPRTALPAIYAGASVYVQLSRAEGLPNVLCEAMLCGCVPIGSAVFGIPEAIGDAGFILERPDPDEIAETIRRALQLGPEARKRARERICERFTREGRRQKLLTAFDVHWD